MKFSNSTGRRCVKGCIAVKKHGEEGSKLWYNMTMEKRTIILAAPAIVAIMSITAFALMEYDNDVPCMRTFHRKTQHWNSKEQQFRRCRDDH